MSDEAIGRAEQACHKAVKEFQAALAGLAELQPLELAEAIAEGQGLDDWPELCRLAEVVYQAAQEVEALEEERQGRDE
jgi:hypothetical protein